MLFYLVTMVTKVTMVTSFPGYCSYLVTVVTVVTVVTSLPGYCSYLVTVVTWLLWLLSCGCEAPALPYNLHYLMEGMSTLPANI